MLSQQLAGVCKQFLYCRDSSPGTPTFGGGAQGNSLVRDGSLVIREGSLYKDGSITSCLQAAFQAQLEEEDQEGQQVG